MIKHEVLCNQQVYASTADIKKIIQDIFKKISNCYNWTKTNISDTTNDISQIYGAFYFSENACIQIRFSQIDSYDYKVFAFNIIVDAVITGKGTTTLMTGNTNRKAKNWKITAATTNNGLALCLWNETEDTRNTHDYNFFIGNATNLDGSVTKQCIYLKDDNSYSVISDNGISQEPAFISTIDNTRKAQLVAAADSTTGAIFNDTYMMFNTPLQYNKMKILGTGKIFLLGKSFCLAD